MTMRIPWFKSQGPPKEKIGQYLATMKATPLDVDQCAASPLVKLSEQPLLRAHFVECGFCRCLLYKSSAKWVDTENSYIQLRSGVPYCAGCAPVYDVRRIKVIAGVEEVKFYRYASPVDSLIEVQEDGSPLPKTKKRATRRRSR